MGTLLDNGDVAIIKPQPQKRRKKKSVVWDHFTIENVGGGSLRACCNQCNKSFAYSSGPKLSGTSHLKRHIDMGICPVGREQNQVVPYNPGTQNGAAPEPCTKNGTTPVLSKKRPRASNGPLSVQFDQKRCNHEIARMIILHDYPLDMVEHTGFIDFVRSLQPQFQRVSSGAIYDECRAIYSKEKMKLSDLLSEIPGRVSLSLNLWTTDETLGYAVLCGHFIDSDWTLHRRLLNVVMVPFPDSEVAFNQAIVSCLSGWGLENKLFALTLDRSFASEDVIGNLRGLLSIKNPHMLNGQFLIGSCYAHVLSSLAIEAINSVKETVHKVRDCVKYVKSSASHEEKFMEIKEQLRVPSKRCLVLDNRSRWDTSYHMLSSASELKEVFACLDTSDRSNVDSISLDEWREIEVLCDYLKRLYDAANILTAQTHPTADKYFSEVCTIQLKLFISAVSEEPIVNTIIKPLIERFESYWKDCSFVLAMAVVMDPRYKLKLVGHYFSELYGEQAESFLRAVEDGLHALYLEYLAQSLPLPSFDVGERHESDSKTPEINQEGLHSFDVGVGHEIDSKTAEIDQEGLHSFDVGESHEIDSKTAEIDQEGLHSFDVGESHEIDSKTIEVDHEELHSSEVHQEGLLFSACDAFADFDIYIDEIPSNHHTKSELDHYMEESLHPTTDEEDFEILGWWKANRLRFPSLSKMAADLLSMPLSTVPRESIFDNARRKVDSSMKPATMETLECSKDWLRCGMDPALFKMEL